MRESKTAAVNLTKKRMVILVKLRVALSRHASVTHYDVYAVRNVDFHLPSGNRTLVDTQAVVAIVRDTGRVRAAYLTFSCEGIQDFVLRMGTQALLKVD